MNRLLPALLLCAACNTPATPAPKTPVAGDPCVKVLRLENTLAEDLAKVLEQTLAARGANEPQCSVVAEPEHNALVLSGTSEQIQKAAELVPELDRRSPR